MSLLCEPHIAASKNKGEANDMVTQRFSSKWPLWLTIVLLFGAAVILTACKQTPAPTEQPPTEQPPTEQPTPLPTEPPPTPTELPPPTPTEPPPTPTEPPSIEVVSTAEEMIAGTGGYDYGEPVANSMHTQFGVNCVNSCHMAPTLDWVDQPGADTYRLTSEDGV